MDANMADTRPFEEQIRVLWLALDKGGSGFLSELEAFYLLEVCGVEMRDDVLGLFMQCWCVGEEHIDEASFIDAYEEFRKANLFESYYGRIHLSAIASILHGNAARAKVVRTWQDFDENGDGNLDADEIIPILISLGMPHEELDVRELFREFGDDRYVEHHDFLSIFECNHPALRELSDFEANMRDARVVLAKRRDGHAQVAYQNSQQRIEDDAVRTRRFHERFLPLLWLYTVVTFFLSLYQIFFRLPMTPGLLTAYLVSDLTYAWWVWLQVCYPRNLTGLAVVTGAKNLRQTLIHNLRHKALWLDFVVVLPLDIMGLAMAQGLDYHPLFRVNKVLLFWHLKRFADMSLENSNVRPIPARIGKAIYLLVLQGHIFGCMVKFVSDNVSDEDTYSTFYMANFAEAAPLTQYFQCYDYAVKTSTGWGRGDPIPRSDYQILQGIVLVITGVCAYAFLLATIANALKMATQESMFLDKLNDVKSFLGYSGFPSELCESVTGYYKHMYRTTGATQLHVGVCDDLPFELMVCLNVVEAKALLRKVPMFRQATKDEDFVFALSLKLSKRVLCPGEIVTQKGEPGSCMFFITHGVCDILGDDGSVVFQFQVGNFFGEVALLHDVKRTATIRAHEFCNVLILTKTDFEEVTLLFPEVLDLIYEAAGDRLKKLEKEMRTLEESHAAGGSLPPSGPSMVLSNHTMALAREASADSACTDPFAHLGSRKLSGWCDAFEESSDASPHPLVLGVSEPVHPSGVAATATLGAPHAIPSSPVDSGGSSFVSEIPLMQPLALDLTAAHPARPPAALRAVKFKPAGHGSDYNSSDEDTDDAFGLSVMTDEVILPCPMDFRRQLASMSSSDGPSDLIRQMTEESGFGGMSMSMSGSRSGRARRRESRASRADGVRRTGVRGAMKKRSLKTIQIQDVWEDHVATATVDSPTTGTASVPDSPRSLKEGAGLPSPRANGAAAAARPAADAVRSPRDSPRGMEDAPVTRMASAARRFDSFEYQPVTLTNAGGGVDNNAAFTGAPTGKAAPAGAIGVKASPRSDDPSGSPNLHPGSVTHGYRHRVSNVRSFHSSCNVETNEYGIVVGPDGETAAPTQCQGVSPRRLSRPSALASTGRCASESDTLRDVETSLSYRGSMMKIEGLGRGGARASRAASAVSFQSGQHLADPQLQQQQQHGGGGGGGGRLSVRSIGGASVERRGERERHLRNPPARLPKNTSSGYLDAGWAATGSGGQNSPGSEPPGMDQGGVNFDERIPPLPVPETSPPPPQPRVGRDGPAAVAVVAMEEGSLPHHQQQQQQQQQPPTTTPAAAATTATKVSSGDTHVTESQSPVLRIPGLQDVESSMSGASPAADPSPPPHGNRLVRLPSGPLPEMRGGVQVELGHTTSVSTIHANDSGGGGGNAEGGCGGGGGFSRSATLGRSLRRRPTLAGGNDDDPHGLSKSMRRVSNAFGDPRNFGGVVKVLWLLFDKSGTDALPYIECVYILEVCGVEQTESGVEKFMAECMQRERKGGDPSAHKTVGTAGGATAVISWISFLNAYEKYRQRGKFIRYFGRIHLAAIASVFNGNTKKERAIKTWRDFDVDGDGNLDKDEIVPILQSLGLPHEYEDVVELFEEFHREDNLECADFVTIFSCDHPVLNQKTEFAGQMDLAREVILKRHEQKTGGAVVYRDSQQLKLDLDYERRMKHDVLIPLVFLYVLACWWVATASLVFPDSRDPEVNGRDWWGVVLHLLADGIFVYWMYIRLTLPLDRSGTQILRGKAFLNQLFQAEHIVDLLIALPTDIVGLGIDGWDYSAWYRANKLLLIYHVPKLFTKTATGKRSVPPQFARIGGALFALALIAHILACFFNVVQVHVGDDAASSTTTIENYSALPSMTMYIQSYDYALKTMVGLSRGQPIPERDAQIVMALVTVVTGVAVYAFVLATISNAQQVRTQKTVFLEKIDKVNSFLGYSSLPEEIKNDAMGYYRHLYRTTGQVQMDVRMGGHMDDLPYELDVVLSVTKIQSMLERVPIFRDAARSEDFVYALSVKVKKRVLSPGETVTVKGEPGSNMYFITHGVCNIVADNGHVVFQLKVGNFFGEIALLHNTKRTATIVADQFCNVLVLEKIDFEEVCGIFPEALKRIQDAAADRLESIKRDEAEKKRHELRNCDLPTITITDDAGAVTASHLPAPPSVGSSDDEKSSKKQTKTKMELLRKAMNRGKAVGGVLAALTSATGAQMRFNAIYTGDRKGLADAARHSQTRALAEPDAVASPTADEATTPTGGHDAGAPAASAASASPFAPVKGARGFLSILQRGSRGPGRPGAGGGDADPPPGGDAPHPTADDHGGDPPVGAEQRGSLGPDAATGDGGTGVLSKHASFNKRGLSKVNSFTRLGSSLGPQQGPTARARVESDHDEDGHSIASKLALVKSKSKSMLLRRAQGDAGNEGGAHSDAPGGVPASSEGKNSLFSALKSLRVMNSIQRLKGQGSTDSLGGAHLWDTDEHDDASGAGGDAASPAKSPRFLTASTTPTHARTRLTVGKRGEGKSSLPPVPPAPPPPQLQVPTDEFTQVQSMPGSRRESEELE